MGDGKRKTLDKGKAGELFFQEYVIAMVRAGIMMDYKKPTFTNEPDDGLDFELKAPHNIGEIMDALRRAQAPPPPSDTAIHVRVDVKNPRGKIGKPVVDKFLGDIEKNPRNSEHWLAGGRDLTAPAKATLDEAPVPCRYYSWDDFRRMEKALPAIT